MLRPHSVGDGEINKVRALPTLSDHILIGPLMKFYNLRKYTGKMFLLIVYQINTSMEEDNRFAIYGLLTEDPHNRQPDSLSYLNLSIAAN